MSELLRAECLHKDYRTEAGTLPVLRGIDLSIEEGEIGVIMGHSGVGKSTLLHILGLLDIQDSGHLLYGDRDISRQSEAERSRIRNEEIGFIFQFFHLLPDLTAMENVLLPSMVQQSYLGWLRSRRENRGRARELLELVGLGDRLHHRPSQLSGGEKQRVAIARALIGSPRIVFCDEPTGNLDSASSDTIRSILWKLNAEKRIAFLIVTHNPEIAQQANWVAKMVDGQLKEFARTPPTL